uniref:Uncharacterized protein n=1 Tax=Quercus lobata TaxID=97700 RepID=A0A7N2KVH0_QUELO
MMKKELEKDPALANENWDRFLPKFKKKNVQQKKVKTKEKKPYTPFPPPQQPSKKKKSAKTWQEKQDKQAQKTAGNKRKREAAFIPPEPRKQDTKSEDDNKDVAAMAMSLKKKAKDFGKQKLSENINAFCHGHGFLHWRAKLDESKKRFVHQLTLSTPFVVSNYLPESVSLTIESGGVTCTAILSEVETSLHHIGPSHDLGLEIHVQP